MKSRISVNLFFLVGLALFACQSGQVQTTTVEPSPPIQEILPSEQPTNQPIIVQPSPIVQTSIPVSTKVSRRGTYIQSGFALQIPRSRHTGTLLPNGNVLFIGGSLEPDDFVADEELFNPLTGSSTWIAPLHTPRHGHTTTLLQDGRILVVGGYSLPQQWLGDAEVYDPISDTWTVIPPLYPHGTEHTATLMKDGRILVVGGCIGSGICTNRVEIFDPKTDSWKEATPLKSDRASHTAQLLINGRVLIAGGTGAIGGVPLDGTALTYNPKDNSWTTTSDMNNPRLFAKSVQLSDGKILVTGGILASDPSNQTITNTSEIYDPAKNRWIPAASLSQARYAFVLVALPNGKVLAIGGTRNWECCWMEDSFISDIESYDPVTDQWSITGKMPQPRAYATGILLSNGMVWIAGGQSNQSGLTFSPDTWLIDASNP